MPLRISLVLATLDRPDDVKIFLRGLLAQRTAYPHEVELIIVDQSTDDGTERVVADSGQHPGLTVKYQRISGRGLSRARNIGLAAVTGDVVGFPDDDCVYHPGVLDVVIRELDSGGSGPDLITVRTRAGEGQAMALIGQPDVRTPMTVWKHHGCSFTLFFKRSVVATVGPFDERMGVGSALGFSASEEEDYIARALFAGFNGIYVPDATVFHPVRGQSLDSGSLTRSYKYARGYGFLMRKHRAALGLRFIMARLGRRFARSVAVPLDPVRSVVAGFEVAGMVRGYIDAGAVLRRGEGE